QTSATMQTPTDWSHDGRLLSVPDLTSGFDLWMFPMRGQQSKFLSLPGDQLHGNFSPNGLLVAYSSSQEFGRFEVFVSTTKKDPQQQWKESRPGGVEPRWRADGHEIYYLSHEEFAYDTITRNNFTTSPLSN